MIKKTLVFNLNEDKNCFLNNYTNECSKQCIGHCELQNCSKDCLNDCCSILSRHHCGLQTEGSFKNKNELLSMEIDSCTQKDRHPFKSDEIKGKRTSSSLSPCMETLSAKR